MTVALGTSYLVAYAAVLGVVVATLLLVMIVELTGGEWFRPFRRHAVAIVGTLPALAILFVPILLFARALYPWIVPGSAPASLRQAIAAKHPYLVSAFAVARAALYWAAWLGLGESVRAAALRSDAGTDPDAARRMRFLSAAGIPILAITLSLAAFDWLMSLTPQWTSSAYAVYYVAGAMVGSVALLAVLAPGAAGIRDGTSVPAPSLRSLGNLLLTFVLLWAYVAYLQYLIVWIADVPREIEWYAVRTRDGWAVLGGVLLIGHLVLPFLVLLLRAVKQSPRALLVVGIWLLLMHYLDVYWLVVPATGVRIGLFHPLVDAAMAIAVAGLTFVAGFSRQRMLRLPATHS